MKWSKEQLEAIYTRNCNVLVAAAAGAGKTTVLVERILTRVLEENTPINHLLVVTFTKAAANEMRGRIAEALSKKAKEGYKRNIIERQLMLLGSAQISTIHSFCQAIIKKYFYKIDLDPAFKLASSAEIDILKMDTVYKLIEELYEAGDEELYHLASNFGGQQDDEVLTELILKLYEFSSSNPWPGHWLAEIAEIYNIAKDVNSIDDTIWANILLDKFAFSFKQAIFRCQRVSEDLKNEGIDAYYLDKLKEEEAYYEILLTKLDCFKTLRNALISEGEEKVKGRVKEPVIDKDLKKRYTYERDRIRALAKDIRNNYFTCTEELWLQNMRETYPLIKALVGVVNKFRQAYSLAKKRKVILDFNDLEHFALQILLQEGSTPAHTLPSEAALELQGVFEEVMIDEYQDTNSVQELILSLVSKDNARFMVGDVKQSIYRFRLAEPVLFLNKYKTYHKGEPLGDKRIDLVANYRSEANILHLVNLLFSQIMSEQAAELDYKEDEYLSPGRATHRGESEILTDEVEIHVLGKDEQCSEEDSNATDDGDEETKELSTFEKEALYIAKRIKELIDSESLIFDKTLNQYRPIKYKDIVILLRSIKGKTKALLEAFRSYKIPLYAPENTGYLENVEVEVILSLLKLIDNPEQDIELAAVLRSPIGNFSANELAQIRIVGRSSFWEELNEYIKQDQTSELTLKVSEFITKLNNWRLLTRRFGVADLIYALLNDTGYYDYVGAMPSGETRQANLQALYDRALQYEQTNFRGLFRFLRFIDNLKAQESDLASISAVSENDNVVRLMTIHKSKGLEFPVVFVAALGNKFSDKDKREKVVFHKEFGLGAPYINAVDRYSYPTIAMHAIKWLLEKESKAEEQRILYVALTRARDKLILVGSIESQKTLKKKCLEWIQFAQSIKTQLPAAYIMGARSYLDWLMPALARHDAGITLYQWLQEIPPINYLDTKARFTIKLINNAEIIPLKVEVVENNPRYEMLKDLLPFSDGVYSKLLDEQLSFKYEHMAHTIPAKLTVTELNQKDKEKVKAQKLNVKKQTIAKRPFFVKNDSDALTAAEKGTVIHKVLEHIDLKYVSTREDIEQEVARLVAQELISPLEAQVVDIELLDSFFKTTLGERLQNATNIWRELPFCTMIKADEYNEETQSEEKIFVQGIIDCLLEYQGRYILIDYKTDKASDEAEIRQKYQGQINFYARAVKEILKVEPTEKYIYLLRSEKLIAM